MTGDAVVYCDVDRNSSQWFWVIPSDDSMTIPQVHGPFRSEAAAKRDARMFAQKYVQQETIAVTTDVEQPSSEQTWVERLVRHVLSNVVSGVAKLDDAPSSAGTHFDSAINELAKATEWRPDDHELQTIILDAIEHMRVYGTPETR